MRMNKQKFNEELDKLADKIPQFKNVDQNELFSFINYLFLKYEQEDATF